MQKSCQIICSFKKKQYLCIAIKQRAFSSAGSEHLPYKQRVGGSNPSTPTKPKTRLLKSGLFLFPTPTKKAPIHSETVQWKEVVSTLQKTIFDGRDAILPPSIYPLIPSSPRHTPPKKIDYFLNQSVSRTMSEMRCFSFGERRCDLGLNKSLPTPRQLWFTRSNPRSVG